MDWICVAQDRENWRPLGNTGTELQIPKMCDSSWLYEYSRINSIKAPT